MQLINDVLCVCVCVCVCGGGGGGGGGGGICNIKHRLSCKFSSQKIFYANTSNPLKQPIRFLNWI